MALSDVISALATPTAKISMPFSLASAATLVFYLMLFFIHQEQFVTPRYKHDEINMKMSG